MRCCKSRKELSGLPLSYVLIIICIAIVPAGQFKEVERGSVTGGLLHGDAEGTRLGIKLGSTIGIADKESDGGSLECGK